MLIDITYEDYLMSNACDSGQESFVVCVLNITATIAEDGRYHLLQYWVINNVEGLLAWAMA